MCTRVFNNKDKNYLSTARNMDWMEEFRTTLYAFDKGLKKRGLEGNQGLKWKSKYKSIVAIVGDSSSYAAADGINSNGLMANALYDSDAEYYEQTDGEDELSILRFVQYILDRFGTVDKVVSKLTKSLNINQSIKIVNAAVPGEASKPATLHISVSDKYGDSAIIEILDKKAIITHSEKANIMTNSPGYKKQMELMSFWNWQWDEVNNDRTKTMPGSAVPSDRFARASLYYKQLKDPETIEESLFQTKSIVMNASVALGYIGDKDSPYVSNTIWSTIANHKENIYYFVNARTPNAIWIELNSLKFKKSKVLSLNVVDITKRGTKNKRFDHNNVTKQLKADVDPFTGC